MNSRLGHSDPSALSFHTFLSSFLVLESHQPGVARLPPEGVGRPLLPGLPRILFVLLGHPDCTAQPPSLLQFLLVLRMQLLGPSPIIDLKFPDVVARLEDVPAAAVLEEGVHLLEGSPGRLGVHEDDEGQAEDVEPEQEQECTVADGLEQEGGDHRDDAVADGPANHGPGATFRPDVQGEDLGGVEPRGGEPGGAKSGGVEERHGGNGGAVRTLVGPFDLGVFIKDTGNEEDEGHADGAPDHGAAATEAVEGVDGEDDAKHIADVVETGQELRELQAKAGVLEEVDGVDCNDANTDEFLHDLEPDGQEDSPA